MKEKISAFYLCLVNSLFCPTHTSTNAVFCLNSGQSKFNSRSTLSSAPSTLTVSSYCTHSAGSLPTPRSEGEILASPNLKPFTFSELRNATRNFRPDSLLGEGGFGYVFKGWIDEQSLAAAKPGSGIVIAVKKLKPEGFQGHKEWLVGSTVPTLISSFSFPVGCYCLLLTWCLLM